LFRKKKPAFCTGPSSFLIAKDTYLLTIWRYMLTTVTSAKARRTKAKNFMNILLL